MGHDLHSAWCEAVAVAHCAFEGVGPMPQIVTLRIRVDNVFYSTVTYKVAKGE